MEKKIEVLGERGSVPCSSTPPPPSPPPPSLPHSSFLQLPNYTSSSAPSGRERYRTTKQRIISSYVKQISLVLYKELFSWWWQNVVQKLKESSSQRRYKMCMEWEELKNIELRVTEQSPEIGMSFISNLIYPLSTKATKISCMLHT